MLPSPERPGSAACPGVLLFGGTFDPVHRGHTELAFAARDLLFPNGGGREGWLVFVPAAISPHKAARPTPARHRVEMLRLACLGRSRWWVWTEELNRAERAEAGGTDAPSYWVDTLTVAAEQHHDLSFLIGADQALAFNRWHRWRDILSLARPVVIARDPIRTGADLRESIARAGWDTRDAEDFLAGSHVLDTPLIDTNATEIRGALASGEPGPIRGLDPAVQRYAAERGLYAKG